MDKNNIHNRIIQIMVDCCLCSVADISEITRLYHDLKISGDDAQELLKKVSEEFNINFDEKYISHRFSSERDERSLVFFLRRKFASRDFYIETTVNDLVNYVQDGLKEREKNTL